MAVAFGTDVNWLDWTILIYGAIITVICLFHICPFAPYFYRCRNQTYDAAHIETYSKLIELHGLNPNSPRSSNDSRTIDKAFLRYDLLREKVVWHNDYKLDLFLFIRLKHPLFAIFFGHTLDSYNLTERKYAFIGTHFLVFGISSWITLFITLMNLSNTVFTAFIVSLIFDLLFGVLILNIEMLFEYFAKCECVDNNRKTNKCCRHCCKQFGHCFMLLLILFCVVFGVGSIIGSIALIIEVIASNNPSIGTVWLIIFINYVTGLITAWFMIDFIIIYFKFTNEWRLQRGEKNENKINWFINDCIHCNMCCCASFMCGWFIFYYLCCFKHFAKKENSYPKDNDGNVIGSRFGEFAITWQDYVNYKENKELKKRDFDVIFEKIGIDKNALLPASQHQENINVEIELQAQTQTHE